MKTAWSFLAAGAVVLAASPGLAQIKIAVVGPRTGQFAVFGEQMAAGAKMAVAQINATGGVNGQRLELLLGDDACDPKQATAVANKMVEDKVVFVAGHYCASSSIPASNIYREGKILQIAPASTTPKLTEVAAARGNSAVFQIGGRWDQLGGVAGRNLAATHKNGRIAILDDGTAYGRDAAEAARKALTEAGVMPVFSEQFAPRQDDYSNLVDRMMSSQPSIVFIGGQAEDAAQMLRRAKAVRPNVVFMVGDTMSGEQFWKTAGGAAAGTLMIAPDDPRGYASASDVIKKFRDARVEPEGSVLYTYAAVQIWAMAANAAGAVDSGKVAEKLRKKTWNSVIGPIAFDSKGDRRATAYSIRRLLDSNIGPRQECAQGCSLDANGKCVCPQP